MYKLVVYVPKDGSGNVKKAIFDTGAGCIGNYSQCCFVSKGIGQFMPMEGSNPSVGVIGELERVIEMKLEILCTEENIRQAISAMKTAHPYEEPAYDVLSLENHRFS